MYKIFLVEDDRGIAEAIAAQTALWDMETVCVKNFREVLPEFTACAPQLVLLDISLPCYDGYHWCREIRNISKVPIIFISSASDNMNIVMAMNMGADDFIAKPFDQSVLMAKINAMLRRTYDFGQSSSIIEHRGAVLNTGDGSLAYKGEKVDLTKNEYRILLGLMQQKGKIVSREKLMELLWESDEFVDDNTLTVNIARLRKKLDVAGLPDFILTKHGMGYLIE
ncbi:MAG: response regulator transcription factor [Lachnospiraceae bacterium]|nr:response regulator transcription factor [Lachnospiraceae bacterium]